MVEFNSLYDRPLEYKLGLNIKSLSDSTITCAQQSDGRTKIMVNIAIGNPNDWAASVYSSVDYGRGCTGSHDPAYPCWVENFSGSGTGTQYRTYEKPGNYIITLAPRTSSGGYDYCHFTVGGGGGGQVGNISITSSTSVHIGSTAMLSVSCTDKQGSSMKCPQLHWLSNNTSVANVDQNGFVTGVSSGSTQVIAVDPSTNIVSNPCQVTVLSDGGGCTNPKYKCSGSNCISDNCDGSGNYTSSNCNNVCGGAGVDVKVITVTFDDTRQPYMRTVTVTGTGTGSYQIKEGGSVIHNGNMSNGFDSYNQNGIPEGTHTYCASPSSNNACETFTVGSPLPVNRWSCSDKCTNASTVGEYTSQSECKQKCVILPPECPSTDNTLVVDNHTPDTETPINMSVRLSGGAGKQWRVIAISGSVIGFGDTRVSTGTLILDSNGCGTAQVTLTKPGQYTLVGRWCNEWSTEEHCSLYDSDSSRVTVVVTPFKPKPSGCTINSDCGEGYVCLLGSCYKKNDLILAGAAFVGLLILTR